MILYIVFFSRVINNKQRAYNYLHNIFRRIQVNFIYKLVQLRLIYKNDSTLICDSVLPANSVLKFFTVNVMSLNCVGYSVRKSDSNVYKVFSNTLYIDEVFIFINKPFGLATQPGHGLRVSAVQILNKLYGPTYAVHRLDKGTTGCILFVRLKDIVKHINRLFFVGGIKKRYYAVVNNVFYGSFCFSFSCVVEGNEKDKLCVSLYKVVVMHNYPKFTLLLITLVTGRKHQLRSGLCFFGNPVYGDSKYKNDRGNVVRQPRLLLHAKDVFIPTCSFVPKEINVIAKLDYMFCYILFNML